jgi:hypothetical protein
LHPFAFNLKKLARRLYLPFSPLSPLMIIFILFPSMGVWAMRTRLHYYIASLYQPWTESEQVPEQRTSSQEERSLAYRNAQRLREKLQSQINQLLSRKLNDLGHSQAGH